MGLSDQLTYLPRNLYAGQEATVRTGCGTINWFHIGKGVHQGYVLSPCLLNLYAEYIMGNSGLDEAQAGIKIAGRNINNLRYADDTHPYGRKWRSKEAETPILWPPDAKSWLIWKDPDAGKDWEQEKGMTEDKMVGWHHWLNGHGFGWTSGVGDGRGGLACCVSWGHKESDMTEWLNSSLAKPFLGICLTEAKASGCQEVATMILTEEC